MGKLDGINIHHTDQFHKKNEDIDMKGRRIDNIKTVCMNDNTTNLKYAINMECLLNYTTLQLSETLFWEYYQQASAFYHFTIGNSNELTYDANLKVSKLFDQSLSQDHAQQSTTNLQPTLCTKANRREKRYFLEFDGSGQRMISNIDLNPAAGEPDIVNVFVVYNISSLTNSSHWTRGGGASWATIMAHLTNLFSPQGDLIVSGTVNDHIVIGQNTTNGRSPIAQYQSKGSAGQLNTWIALSVHWNISSEKSYVYCNGKKLCEFTARSSVGSTTMTFGDINPNEIAPFHGKIGLFCFIRLVG